MACLACHSRLGLALGYKWCENVSPHPIYISSQHDRCIAYTVLSKHHSMQITSPASLGTGSAWH